MLDKIDIRDVVVDHFRTLVDYSTGSRRKADYALFLGLPLVIAGTLALGGVFLSQQAISILTNVLAVLAGLLFNLLVVLHTLAARHYGPTSEKDSRDLFRDVYSNIAYSVLVALATLIPLIISNGLKGTAGRIGSSVAVFLVIHFALTLLMVLKRIHALLAQTFRSVGEG